MTTTPKNYPPELAAIIAAFDKTLNEMDNQLTRAERLLARSKKQQS